MLLGSSFFVCCSVGVRAGWQCPDCRVCQVCRQPEDDSKVMLCEKCDKAYHAQCLRPIVTTIPKIGWKCKVSFCQSWMWVYYVLGATQLVIMFQFWV